MDIYDLLKMADDKTQSTYRVEEPYKELYTLAIASELHKKFDTMGKNKPTKTFPKKLFAKQR